MYGKNNMETYITICKIDSQQKFAVWLRKLKQGLCINLERWDGAHQATSSQQPLLGLGCLHFPFPEFAGGLESPGVLVKTFSASSPDLRDAFLPV